MMKHKYFTPLLLVLPLFLAACHEDVSELTPENGGDALVLVASSGDGFASTRSVENPTFQKGTLFHLYATKYTDENNTDDWSKNVNYLSSDGKQSTIARAEAVQQVDNAWRLASPASNSNDALAGVFHDKPLNFYGVTVVGVMADTVPDTDSLITANNALLDSCLSSTKVNGVPQYTFNYDTTSPQPLPDIMWSDKLKNLVPYSHAGRQIMPYIHSLSKLNFYVAEADDLKSDYVGKMTVKSLTINDYAGGTLSMANGLYTREVTAARQTTVGMAHFQEKTVGADATHFATTLIFPTDGAIYETDTVKPTVADKDAATVTLVVDVNGTQKTYKDLKLTYVDVDNNFDAKNELFKPNFEYDVTFSLTTSSVLITIVPKYYDYIPNELPLEEYELGEPIDFGGVLWAAQNLGATSSDPTANALAWEKARGFFYQFGRSIPYYVGGSMEDPFPMESIYDENGFKHNDSDPASWWDGENLQWLYTGAGEAKHGENFRVPFGRVLFKKERKHGARAWPYIPFLWEKVIKDGGTYQDYLAGTRFCSENYFTSLGQTEPTRNISDPYYATLYGQKATIDGVNGEVELNQFAFSSYSKQYTYSNETVSYYFWNQKQNSASTNNWSSDNGVMNSPAPKGWRVPTKEEFLSIIPSDDRAGDIAFTKFSVEGSTKEDSKDLTQRTYRLFASDEGWNDYKDKDAVYVGIYQDGSGYNDANIAYFDSYSPYYWYKEGWGSVYAIKCYGTDEAYLLRWTIEIADYDEVKRGEVFPSRSEIIEMGPDKYKSLAHLGRGVLVISKYEIDEEKRSQLCITPEAIPGVTQGTAKASHLCRVFVDSSPNRTLDANEEKIEIDWDRPSGQLKLPIPGYVLDTRSGHALIYPGAEAVYWTSTKANPYEAYSLRVKFAGDYATRWIELFNTENVTNGGLIRCVRDTGAEY